LNKKAGRFKSESGEKRV